MTPEEIALKIFEEVGFEGWDDLRADIAQAIRDAYERAAAICDEQYRYTDSSDKYLLKTAADLIRALKGSS